MIKAPDMFLDSPGATISLDWPKDYEHQFWQEYPLKIAKATAFRALRNARKKGVAWQAVIDGVQRYRIWLQGPGWRPAAKHPSTWINAEGWHDELKSTSGGQNGNGATPSQRARQFAERAADLERQREGSGGTASALSISRHSV
jgi:hypothetical protein